MILKNYNMRFSYLKNKFNNKIQNFKSINKNIKKIYKILIDKLKLYRQKINWKKKKCKI